MRNARASLLFAVFSVEAALNSLLAQSNASAELQKKIGFMQFLDKADALASFFGRGEAFDRSAPQVAAFSELLKIRNGLAHPRNSIRKVRGTVTSEGGVQFEDEKSHLTSKLKLPLETDNWSGTHATTAIQAADLFLSYFIINVLNASERLRTHVFVSLMFREEKNPFYMVVHQTEAERLVRLARRRMSLSCAYFPPDTVLGSNRKKSKVRAKF